MRIYDGAPSVLHFEEENHTELEIPPYFSRALNEDFFRMGPPLFLVTLRKRITHNLKYHHTLVGH